MESDLDEERVNLGVSATTNWRKRVEAIFSRGGTSRPPTTRARPSHLPRVSQYHLRTHVAPIFS